MLKNQRHRKRCQLDFQQIFEETLKLAKEEREELEKQDGQATEKVHKRRSKNGYLHRNSDGVVVPMTWADSSWYIYYVHPDNLEQNSKKKSFSKKFRLRFRMPFESYLDFVKEAKDNELFKRWTGFDACGKKSSPIELLILGSLRYLGRGWAFDDIEEATSISEEVHRTFFHGNNSGRSQRT